MSFALAMSRPASLQQPGQSRKRATDWKEFYRNGYPTDIITIEDSPTPVVSTSAPSRGSESVSSPTSSLSSSTSLAAVSSSSTSNLRSSKLAPAFSYSNTSSVASISSGCLPRDSEIGSGNINYAYSASMRGPDGSSALASTFYDVDCLTGSDTLTSSSQSSVSSTTSRRKANLPNLPTSVDASIQVRNIVASPYERPSGSQSTRQSKRRKVELYDSRKVASKASEVLVKSIADTSRSEMPIDDDDGHYNIVPNSWLTSRYKVTRLLGQGTFGKVVAAYDKVRKTHCAIKIIRAVQKYRDASKIELRVLKTLSMHDRQNSNRCIHLRDCFDFRNHICIVTELLSISVFDFLKSNEFAPFPAAHIQKFAKQLLTSVAFLHDLNLIHTDLKPENILLIDSSYTLHPNRKGNLTRKVLNDTTIHLIDFGSATFQDEYHSSVVSTRHYRAPEIILGLGWSFPCDMWSIGCILVEFLTGDALFQTHDNIEHLALMQAVVGQPFDHWIVKAANRLEPKYFTRDGKLDFPSAATSKSSRKFVHTMRSLHQIVNGEDAFYVEFYDLLRRIFVYDPNNRITAREALNHPWLNQIPPADKILSK
ncbi:serine threonine protein kinase [Lipomyces oligophaga]|uniref:serine threonine protein kinase n=1 Tax=Lipomyces oligophaga TaxID=45792 RepID=UPI0034CFE4E9